MDPNTNPACPFVEYLEWRYMGIKLFPLAEPIGSNFFLPDDTPSFRRLGPADVVTHHGQRAIDVPLVERGISLSNKAFCLRHILLELDPPADPLCPEVAFVWPPQCSSGT